MMIEYLGGEVETVAVARMSSELFCLSRFSSTSLWIDAPATVAKSVVFLQNWVTFTLLVGVVFNVSGVKRPQIT